MIAMQAINDLAERIGREFGPDKVILFGSHAYGTAREGSDVDLLVLMEFEGKAFRKSLEMLNRTAPAFSVDILVRTPEDAARRYAEFDPFIREAFDRGKVLYERND